MTNLIKILLGTLFILSLNGCGNFLTAINSDTIEDNPGKRTLGAQIDDETIETKAFVNIYKADERFRQAHIIVLSYNGYVLLAGQVETQALKDLAADILRDVRKVRRIYNELEVSGQTSLMTRSSDTWITAKVKSALLSNSEVEGTRVKVITENGVVYLLGLLSRSEADRVVDSASASYGVRKVIRLFEYID